MIKKTIYSCLAIGLLSGCSSTLVDPEIDFKPPVYVEQMPSQEIEDDFAQKGSIFGQGDNPLFSDHKAMHVNDLVTVVISESASASNSAQKALSEVDSSALGGGLFSNIGAANGRANQAIGTLNGYTNVGFNADSSSSFTGAGSATKDATLTTTVSARIIKVLQNGNYFISGRREIMVDSEKQIIQLSGVIRPYDIDQNNQINSAQIADAKISYQSQGDIHKSNEQGWGTKIVKALWPF
jgi:flagellar L-ring protein precursor FlgH